MDTQPCRKNGITGSQSLLKILRALSWRTMDFSRIIRSDGVSPPPFSFPVFISDFFSFAMISPHILFTSMGCVKVIIFLYRQDPLNATQILSFPRASSSSACFH